MRARKLCKVSDNITRGRASPIYPERPGSKRCLKQRDASDTSIGTRFVKAGYKARTMRVITTRGFGLAPRCIRFGKGDG